MYVAMKESSVNVARFSRRADRFVRICHKIGASWTRLRGREGHTTQYLLRLMHLSSLVCPNEVSNGLDFRLLPVRLRFLRVEWVDIAPHEQISEHEVLEDLDTLW